MQFVNAYMKVHNINFPRKQLIHDSSGGWDMAILTKILGEICDNLICMSDTLWRKAASDIEGVYGKTPKIIYGGLKLNRKY